MLEYAINVVMGFFGRLIKGSLLPLLRYFGKEAVIPFASNLTRDLIDGENLKNSASKRFQETKEVMQNDIFEKLKKQMGRGRKRKMLCCSKISRKRRKSIKRTRNKRKYPKKLF